jgi:hypothetical protein
MAYIYHQYEFVLHLEKYTGVDAGIATKNAANSMSYCIAGG